MLQLQLQVTFIPVVSMQPGKFQFVGRALLVHLLFAVHGGTSSALHY